MLKALAVGTLAAFAVVGAAANAAAQPKDIVDTAVAAGSFNTLAKALEAAGLVQTLKGPGPFTVFAPTDEAFAKLPAGTLSDRLKAEDKNRLCGSSAITSSPAACRPRMSSSCATPRRLAATPPHHRDGRNGAGLTRPGWSRPTLPRATA